MKILKLSSFLAIGCMVFYLTGCVKKLAQTYEDASSSAPQVLLTNQYANAQGGSMSGLSGFKEANFSFANGNTITIPFYVNYAGGTRAPKDIVVNLKIDNAAITAYNTANSTNFQLLTADNYKLGTTSVTIKSGEQYAIDSITITNNSVDNTISYLLPVAIADASGGISIASNENTIYFNFIGNVLAGNYLQSYWRYNGTSDTTQPANSTVGINVPMIIGPITATSVILPEYYLEANFGLGVVLSFDNNNGTLSNFNIFLDDNTKATLTANNFNVTALKLVNATIVGNASTKYAGSTFRIYMEVINSSGALRTMINNFVKQ